MLNIGDTVYCWCPRWQVGYWEMTWGVIFPKQGDYYTVRSLEYTEDGAMFIRVYEIRNPIITERGGEIVFDANGFRKVETSPVEQGTINSVLN